MTSYELIAIVVSAFAIVFAVSISIYTFRKSTGLRTYADLDSLYLEALKLAVEHPEFTDPERTKDYKNSFSDRNQLLAYESYAYIVWNICETIYDRWKKENKDGKTWYPVIEAEKRLHYAWFSNPENHHKFKKEFREFMERDFEKACFALRGEGK